MRTVKVDGHKLKTAREAAGYTQEKLAKLLKVDRSTIAHWESGDITKQPSAGAFKALVTHLEVNRSELLVLEQAA